MKICEVASFKSKNNDIQNDCNKIAVYNVIKIAHKYSNFLREAWFGFLEEHNILLKKSKKEKSRGMINHNSKVMVYIVA